MKFSRIILPFALLSIVACESTETKTTAELREERDSLSTLLTNVQERLLEIDAEIAQLDSTVSYTTVSTHTVQSGSFEHFFDVYGAVETDRNVTLFAESAGMIENISVREGQAVRAGQPLLNIDDDIIRNNIEEVKTSLELAKTLYEKQQRLWEQNVGSQVQLLEAENRYEGLQTRLASLESQLAMSNLTAPFAGIVDEIFSKTGEYAAPGMPLIRLVNTSQVYVTADVPESYINRVSVGTPVTLYFRSIGDTVDASIIQVGQYINPDNRTFQVKVGISETTGDFKPNMMASLRIRDYSADSTVILPSHLIQQDQDGRSYVYIVNDLDGDLATVHRKLIRLGLSYEGQTEVRSGINTDDLVVDRGARSVQSDERIRIVNEE